MARLIQVAAHLLGHRTSGVLESWSYSTPTSFAQILDAVEWHRLREQISPITLCRDLHHKQRGFIPRCLQLRQHQVLDVIVWSTTSWLSHAFVTYVFQLTPQRTAHFPTTEATPPSAFLTRISRVTHIWTSIPPLTERLSSRFAAQSLSVYAMMWSDRTHHL